MKYFKERRRKLPKPTDSEACENAIDNDKVGADVYTVQQMQAYITEQSSQEVTRDRCKDRLICARRRKDIRLTRKEVACLQVLVQTVLSEHLVLSSALQEANERAGLPRNEGPPLTTDVGRGQSTLERDAARLKAALLEREERLESAAADGAALRRELDNWRRESTEEAEKSRAALMNAFTERDSALKSVSEKDQVISCLRSELATQESKRSNEVLCMSRSLRERETSMKKLQSEIQDNTAQLMMLQEEFSKCEGMLEMERTAHHSAEKSLASLRVDFEATGILLSEVLSDKEELKKQLEDAKEEFEHDLKELKRAVDANLAEVKHASEKAVAQKMVELLELKGDLTSAQNEVQTLLSKLEKEKSKDAVLYGELAAARSGIEHARNAFAQLEAKCAQDRARHEEEMKNREAGFRDEIERLRSEAASTQADLEDRLRQLQKDAAAEKETLEEQRAIIKEKLNEAEAVASRLPTLESNLIDAENEIRFLKETATERNAEFAAKTKEAKQYSDEAKRARQEAENLKREKEDEVKKLKNDLELLKAKREDDAAHFRKAMHEKDLVIREGEDRLQQIEAEQGAIQETLSSVQKKLEASAKHYKSSMADAKAAHRENAIRLKAQVAKQSEEIEALKASNGMLHSKLSETHRQHSQEVEKLKASSEKTKNSLEKRIQEKEALLKESEQKRASLSEELSRALESREGILKELQFARDELTRAVDILWEARAETRLALDTMGDTERAMIAIYAGATEDKLVLNKAQLKIDELEEKWISVRKEADDRNDAYNKLQVQFNKYVDSRENDLKAAGDSVKQNREEAQRYLDELKSSKTELASTEERCRTLESALALALRKVEYFSTNESALVAQVERNKQLLTLAGTEVESLKGDLCRQSSDLIQMKSELEERKSAFEILSVDLNKEKAYSANQTAESQDTFDLLESVSRERGLLFNSDAQLLKGADLLYHKIQVLESRLGKDFEQLPCIRKEHGDLKQELSFRTSELNDLKSILVAKDESIEKLKSELNELHEKMADPQNTITEMGSYFEEILNQASAAYHAQESLKVQLEEGNTFLQEANTSINHLKSQLQFEQSRAAELESQLCQMKASYQQELQEKSSSIQDLSESLSRLSELYSKEDLARPTEGTTSVQERLTERDREVDRLLDLLEHAHLECDCKVHHESADGDKEARSDWMKELKAALAEKDADVAKLRSMLVELQSAKSDSDEEIASYRFHVKELLNEVIALRHQLEEQELRTSQQATLDLHLTAEETRLAGPTCPRLSPRRRPGAPGGAPLKRALSEGNGEMEQTGSEVAMGTIDQA